MDGWMARKKRCLPDPTTACRCGIQPGRRGSSSPCLDGTSALARVVLSIVVMNTTRLFLASLACLASIACGDTGGGGNSNLEALEAALNGAAEHTCSTCAAPAGGATALSADVTPDVSAVPFVLSLTLGDPAGLKDAGGAWRVEREFSVNDHHDFVAELPDSAWLLSDDGTVSTVTLVFEQGLPPGDYHVRGMITDAAESAHDLETYTFHHDEPDPAEHEHPEPTPTPHEGGDTGDHPAS